MKKILKPKIQIVFKKRKTIRDILLNQKKFSRNVNTTLSACCCNSIGKAKKHKIMKLKESDLITEEEKSSIRLMDILLPHSPNNYYNLKIEITNLIIKYTKSCSEIMSNKIKQLSKQLTKSRKMEYNNKFIQEKTILTIKKNYFDGFSYL